MNLLTQSVFNGRTSVLITALATLVSAFACAAGKNESFKAFVEEDQRQFRQFLMPSSNPPPVGSLPPTPVPSVQVAPDPARDITDTPAAAPLTPGLYVGYEEDLRALSVVEGQPMRFRGMLFRIATGAPPNAVEGTLFEYDSEKETEDDEFRAVGRLAATCDPQAGCISGVVDYITFSTSFVATATSPDFITVRESACTRIPYLSGDYREEFSPLRKFHVGQATARMGELWWLTPDDEQMIACFISSNQALVPGSKQTLNIVDGGRILRWSDGIEFRLALTSGEVARVDGVWKDEAGGLWTVGQSGDTLTLSGKSERPMPGCFMDYLSIRARLSPEGKVVAGKYNNFKDSIEWESGTVWVRPAGGVLTRTKLVPDPQRWSVQKPDTFAISEQVLCIKDSSGEDRFRFELLQAPPPTLVPGGAFTIEVSAFARPECGGGFWFAPIPDYQATSDATYEAPWVSPSGAGVGTGWTTNNIPIGSWKKTFQVRVPSDLKDGKFNCFLNIRDSFGIKAYNWVYYGYERK